MSISTKERTLFIFSSLTIPFPLDAFTNRSPSNRSSRSNATQATKRSRNSPFRTNEEIYPGSKKDIMNSLAEQSASLKQELDEKKNVIQNFSKEGIFWCWIGKCKFEESTSCKISCNERRCESAGKKKVGYRRKVIGRSI